MCYFQSAHHVMMPSLFHLLFAFPFHDEMINALMVDRSWESTHYHHLLQGLDDSCLILGLVRGLLE